jgi:hypothetical protein
MTNQQTYLGATFLKEIQSSALNIDRSMIKPEQQKSREGGNTVSLLIEFDQ